VTGSSKLKPINSHHLSETQTYWVQHTNTTHWLLFLYLLLRLLHVSTLMCHLQGASFIFVSYWKSETVVSCFIITCVRYFISGLYLIHLMLTLALIYCLPYKYTHVTLTHSHAILAVPPSLLSDTTTNMFCSLTPLYCKCWCTADVVVSCVTHKTTTSAAHQHLQYWGTTRRHNNFGLSGTHKDKGRSLKMAHKCRNM
jgi:hypothetical protein